MKGLNRIWEELPSMANMHGIWAWEEVLRRHGWFKSQCNGAWVRRHWRRRTEIVGGPYIPRYAREVGKLLRLYA